jgi:hypothetical protein
MPLETLHLLTRGDVPHADHRVERSGGDELPIGRHYVDQRADSTTTLHPLTRHRGDTRVDRAVLVVDEIFDPEIKHTLALLNIPDPRRLVSRAGNEEAAVAGKVERVDLLHVSLEEVADALLLDVPDLHPDQPVVPVFGHVVPLTLIWRSSAPVARYLPSGEKQMLRM